MKLQRISPYFREVLCIFEASSKENIIMKNKYLKLMSINILVGIGLMATSCLCSGAENAEASGKESMAEKPASADAVSVKPSQQEPVGNIVEFDKTIHNFGDVMLSDGPLSCSFTMKNISEKPVVIYSVVTSCGCTDVEWTREPIKPGQSGTISTVYTNDEGPYPFDKTLTVYISGIGRPVILRIRGIAHEKKMSLEELYPEKLLGTAVKSLELRCGNIQQGYSRSDETGIANLTDSPVKVTFANVSRGLSLNVTPNPIPAREVARLQFTVTAQPDIWGKNLYYATPVIAGQSSGRQISVYAFTTDDFSDMTAGQRSDRSRPIFTSNPCSIGKIRKGEKAAGSFSFSNVGKEDFVIYKADTDWPDTEVTLPGNVKSGYKGSITVNVDTADMPEGEMLVTVTLTTNSPSRPIVNLFLTGWIE